MKRKYSSNLDVFCYICGKFYTNNTKTVNQRTLCKEPILLILKSSLGMKIKHVFHIKSVGPTSSVETLRLWSHGKDKHLLFGIPVIWR